MDVGEKHACKRQIAYGRQRKGLTSTQLAKMIGVNQGTVIRYENGIIKTIPVANLQKIASILDYSFEELIEDDPKFNLMVAIRNPSRQAEEDEKILSWYHQLPRKYQAILMQLACVDSDE